MATRMTGGTFFCVPNDLVYRQIATLSGAATKVYLVLRCHMNQATGEAFPSYDQMQELTGLQSASVAKGVRELQAAGLVTVRKQGRRSFYHFTNQTTSENEPLQKMNQTASESEDDPLQKVKTNNKKINQTKEPDEIAPPTPAKKSDADFDAWWSACPARMRRCGKGVASDAWRRAKGRAPLTDMLTVLAFQAESHDWTKEGGRFVPMATTYLNQRRWEAEPDAFPRAGPTNGHANGRASPEEKQERTRGNLVEWFVESEGIGEQVDLRQTNGAVGEPLRARTHQGPH